MKKEIQKIFIFGNILLEQDNLPLKLANDLKKIFPKINFIVKDPNENLWPTNSKLVLIDTAVGIKQVEILTDISKIQPETCPCSLHDFDLALNLTLLEKIGELKELIVFAVPQGMSKKNALDQLTKSIKNHLSS